VAASCLAKPITYSFIAVKTERSTLQSVMQDSDYIHVASAYAATQDSNQWHGCHAGQPQPGLAKGCQTQMAPRCCQHPIRWAFTSQSLTRWRRGTHPIERACFSFIDLGRMKGWVGLVGWPVADGLPTQWSPVGCRPSAGQGQFAGQRPGFCQLCYATSQLLYLACMPVLVVLSCMAACKQVRLSFV